MSVKPIIPIEWAVNWYWGNFLMNPNNGLREDEELMLRANDELEGLKKEFSGQKMTHKAVLDLIKERGIHAKYYRYEKPKPDDCDWCRAMRMPPRHY